jgi:hypothetical protein
MERTINQPDKAKPQLAASVSIHHALSLIAAKPRLSTRTGGEFCGAYPWRQFPANWDDNPPLSFDL